MTAICLRISSALYLIDNNRSMWLLIKIQSQIITTLPTIWILSCTNAGYSKYQYFAYQVLAKWKSSYCQRYSSMNVGSLFSFLFEMLLCPQSVDRSLDHFERKTSHKYGSIQSYMLPSISSSIYGTSIPLNALLQLRGVHRVLLSVILKHISSISVVGHRPCLDPRPTFPGSKKRFNSLKMAL